MTRPPKDHLLSTPRPLPPFDIPSLRTAKAAFKKNFTNCPIKDYRDMLRELVVDAGLQVLVYSGDVDAQLPHTATEASCRPPPHVRRCVQSPHPLSIVFL